MESTEMLKVIKARANLLTENKLTFFGHLSLNLKLQEDSTAKTMWTDGETIGFSPEFVNLVNHSELKTVLCHEILHISMNHHTRRGARDEDVWNLACDYCVNDMLVSSGFDLPKGFNYDAKYTGLSVEQIFTILQGQKKKEDQSGKPEDKNGQGKPDDKQQQQQQQNGQGKPDNQGKGQGQGQANTQGQNGQNAPPNDFKKDNSRKDELMQKAGEIRDIPKAKGKPVSEQIQKEEEVKWQIKTTQAANAAEKAGLMPGNVREYVTAMNEPKISWREVLNRFLTERIKNDYSYAKRNCRFSGRIIRPSLISNTLGKVVLAVDSSGSITNADKKAFATEIEEIVYQFKVEVEVIYCDTRIRGKESFTIDNLPIKLDVKGGGGTKFSPVMQYIEELDETPACLIYLTDLDCSDFGTCPDCETLWIQTRGNIRKQVPFGEVVLLK